MKLSITQMVLGIFITIAACYIMGWMIFGVPGLLHMPEPADNGVTTYVDAVPKHEAFFTTARYISGLAFALGLAALVVGTIQAARRAASQSRTVILQMVFGASITASAFVITGWGFPLSFDIPTPEGSNILKHVYINPGPVIILGEFFAGITTLLGLAVLGVGVTQFVKARRQSA
jgi:uncharacterized membrane protein